MNQEEMQAHLTEASEALEVPGVSAGVYHEGKEYYAFHGVTSIENPLSVDENTLFQFGSTGKTYTSTAIMRLVDQGLVDLDERVRTYVPELKLKDENVAREITVLHLLNHTAGWQGDFFENTGEGDDALARFVETMEKLEQEWQPGTSFSYNNASLNLAGRVIEKVTGKTYEDAIKELLLDPLGLDQTYFLARDIMTRRYAIGHNQNPDGSIKVARPWRESRAGTPSGANVTASAGDQIKWARFHLGDGSGVLPEKMLRQMQEPTVDIGGSALGDHIGISWMLRDVDGVRIVGHGGDTIGQHSSFVMIPEKDFAIAVLTNCGPNGSQVKEDFVKWAFKEFAGVDDRDPEPIDLSEDKLAQYAGTYETIAAKCELTPAGGGLEIKAEIKPETKAQLMDAGEEIPEQPPIPIKLLPGEGDRYIVSDGPAKGMKGYFVRNASGEVESVHVGGRLAIKTSK